MTRSLFRFAAPLRTIASTAATVLGLLLVTFIIGRLIPIDPVLTVVGDRATPEAYAAARAALGLDDSLAVQFLRYLKQALTGDFGTAVLTGRPVIEDIGHAFPATLELATVATLIGIAGGLPLGVTAAVHHGRWPDHLARLIAVVGYSVPVFWLGLVGLLVFYARLDWVAGPGRLDIIFDGLVPDRTGVLVIDALLAGEIDAAGDALSHLILPASILGWFSMAYLARMTRSLMLEQLSQDYILTARVKGLSEGRVVWVHAFGNAAGPLAAVVALSYAHLLEGSVLTETVFAWPGLGLYLTNALLNADMNAVLGATLVVGGVFIGLNLAADALQRRLDPRTRETSAR